MRMHAFTTCHTVGLRASIVTHGFSVSLVDKA